MYNLSLNVIVHNLKCNKLNKFNFSNKKECMTIWPKRIELAQCYIYAKPDANSYNYQLWWIY